MKRIFLEWLFYGAILYGGILGLISLFISIRSADFLLGLVLYLEIYCLGFWSLLPTFKSKGGEDGEDCDR